MAENTDNIMLEILKRLQEGQSRLEVGQRQTNERLAAIEHHMAGFHVTLTSYTDDMDALKDRVSRIERRLDISDEPQDDTNT